MKKYLKKQINRKLRVLKNRNFNSFLCMSVLNLRLKELSNFDREIKIKLNILQYSNLRFKLKKKVSFTQIVTQCNETWRTRSVYSFFKLSRIMLREYASFGLIKGLRKSSW